MTRTTLHTVAAPPQGKPLGVIEGTTDFVDSLRDALADRYLIEREIGRGGMAVVFLAKDLKQDRSVAIKVLRPEYGATLHADRFHQEIRIVRELAHPGILPVFESGSVGHTFFYVMPYIQGETLRKRINRERQLPIPEVIALTQQLADALTHAHGRGFVHRDVKPENILLSEGHAIVADFGIARALDEAGGERLTSSGLLIGTPAYMSPEQCSKGGAVDARSDVYSLACVVYEMLAGEPPFTGPNVQAIFARQAAERPRSIRVVRTVVSPALEAEVMRGLAKVPADRFASAAAFAEALGAAPVEASGEDVTEPKNSVAVLPFVDGSAQHDLDYFCDGMTEAVMAALTRVPRLLVAARRSVLPFKGKGASVREIGHQLGVRHVLEGTVRTAQDRLRVAVTLTDVVSGFDRWSEQYDRNMTDVFHVQDEIAESIVGALEIALSGERGTPAPITRQTDNVDAYRLYLQGRHYWNRRFQGGLQKAIECFQGALERDPLYSRAYSGLADCFVALCTYEFLPPSDGLPRAASAAQKALELDDSIAEAHASKGLVCMHRWEWEQAERSILRCIELAPDYATAHQYYSMWYAAHGRMDDALRESERARELDPLSPLLSAQVGWMLYFSGRFSEAIRSLRNSLEVHPTFAVARGMLGQALAEMNQHEDAIRELKETALSFPPAAGALGYAYAVAGRSEEARETLTQLERRSEFAYVSPYGRAIVYAGLGDREKTFEWLERACEAQSFYMILIAVNPMFARIRDDQRFRRLLERMKLA